MFLETRPYVGFWNRTAAALIDSVLLLVVTLPIQQMMSGAETGWSGGQPPGKMFMSAAIVDTATGGKPSTRQLLIRYIGYYVAAIPLLLGLIWVAADPRKQGWHDSLAGTVVVSTASKSMNEAAVCCVLQPWYFCWRCSRSL